MIEKFKDFPRFSRNSVGNVFVLDTAGFDHVTVHLSGTFTASMFWEGSNDPNATSWAGLYPFNVASGGSSQLLSAVSSTNTIWVIPAYTRYVRLRISSYTSGTVNADVTMAQGVPHSASVNAYLMNSTVVPLIQAGTTYFVKTTAAVLMANIKTSGANLIGMCLKNNSASDRYVRLYNKNSAPLSSDTPVVVWRIPSGGDMRFDHELAVPRFSSGLGIGITAGAADNDTTAPGANDVSGFVLYS